MARRTLAAALVLVVPLVLMPTAAGALGFGMSSSGYEAMASAGAAPEYTQYWVGLWTEKYGWSGLESALAKAKANGKTLVIEWYYWGDAISPSCVEYGCEGRSRTHWTTMTDTLASKVAASGAKAVIVVESEFNKNGIEATSYAPTFDTRLRAIEDRIEAKAPNAKIAIGFGTWNLDNWKRFPKAIAGADYIGFQAMAASTRHTSTEYMAVDETILSTAKYAKSTFGKSSILHDVALSSYPSSTWESKQRDEIKAIVGRSAEYATAGLVAVVWREYKDNPNMDGYFGEAEEHWGMKRADGSSKPAWYAWLDGIKAYRRTATTTTTTTTTSTTFDASFSSVKIDKWWQEVKVTGTKPVAGVDIRVDGGTWKPLTYRSWGAWAGSTQVDWGDKVEFRARATDGSTDVSSAYGRTS